MFGTPWLGYFEGNARPDCAPAAALSRELPPALQPLLALSLGRFQLGESAGGRIHAEIMSVRDAALDAPSRRAVQLYIEEEWRHARELALVIGALGGRLQTAHFTNDAFTACRRVLGLRTKMMTLAIAEVIGIVYYRALAHGLGSRALACSLERIANEESRHLDFQAAFFDRVVASAPRRLRFAYRWLLCGLMFAIFALALLVLLVDHRRILRVAGASQGALVRAAFRELADRRFLRADRLASVPAPRYA
jgi:hypothetical protein